MTIERAKVPGTLFRIISVWKRHIKVYLSNFGNAFPPLIEPIIFIVGMGIGLGKYIGEQMMGVEYIAYLAPGLAADIATWTATFECTFGTFIRLNFDNIYEPIASTPVSVEEIFLGELLFTGTKGFIFTTLLLIEITIFGYVKSPFALFMPFIGFLSGVIFGAIGLLVTSVVKSINTLNFYISGFLLPMIFLSGVFYPIEQLPKAVHPISQILPLTHSVIIMRACSLGTLNASHIINFGILLFMAVFFATIGVHRIKRKVII